MYTLNEEIAVVIGNKYIVESVVKTDAPEGLSGDNWYRYIIVFDRKSIECMKQGSLFEVTQHAEEFAENLNDRSSRFGGVSYRPRRE